MKKTFGWAAVMTLLLMLATTTAKADDGDRWHDEVIAVGGGNYYCYLEVVSEQDATVKIINRQDENRDDDEVYVNTLATVANTVTKFSIKSTAKHNGKYYTIIGIGPKAFIDMEALEEVTYLGDNIEFIDWEAFRGCRKLETIHLPESLDSIGQMAFMECWKLSCTNTNGTRDARLVLPSKLRSIGNQAFSWCDMTEVYFNDNLKFIDRWGFAHCRKLQDVTLSNGTDVVGNVFPFCDNVKNINTKSVKNDSKIWSVDGVLYRYNNNRLDELAAFPSSRTGSFVIPDNVTKIGSYAFEQGNLSSVTIPASVKEMGVLPFVDCKSLTSVYVEWLSSDELPTQQGKTSPFYIYGGMDRTLYIPGEGVGTDVQGILDSYVNSNWTEWFSTIKHYDPGNVQGLIVAGWPVKRTNVKNIQFPEIKTGRVSYDLASKTLTLDEVFIQTTLNEDWAVGNKGIQGMNIYLKGYNEFNCNSAGIYMDNITYITGTGSLRVDSEYEEAIYIKSCDLYVKDATLNLNGRQGGLVGDGDAYIYPINTKITMSPTGNAGVAAMNGVAQYYMSDCFISYPTFGTYDKDKQEIVNWDGQNWYGSITIEPGQFYDFYIGDTPVTNKNCYDLQPAGLRSGTLSYDPTANELTVHDIDFFANASFLTSNKDMLKVKLVGDNKVNTTDDCLWLLAKNTILHSYGNLKAVADLGVGARLNGDWTWLYVNDTDVTLEGTGGGIYGDAEDTGVSIGNSHLLLPGNGRYQVTKGLMFWNTDNSKFVREDYHFSKYYGCVCDHYDDPVYDDIEMIPTGIKTGLTEVTTDAAEVQDTPLYDLQGRRLTGTPQKGIFIQNGRKVVVK